MTRNPYSPPSANVEMAISQPRGARPISAWFLLIAIALFGLLWAVGTVRFIFIVVSSWEQFFTLWGVLRVLWATVVLPFLVLGVLLASLVGIYKRKPWGRWLGLLILAGFAVFNIFRPDTTVYANEA